MEHPAKIIKKLNIAPLKKFGQNFLMNTGAIQNIIEYIKDEKKILEIGPGLGAISDMLINHHKLILCEKDRALSKFLVEKYKETSKIEIISDDFLKVKPEFWKEKKITGIISNLPFYITSDIIIKIIKEMKFINCALLGMQKEMAERILKKKGSSISIFLNITGDTKKAAFVSRKNFYPEPEVDSIWIYWLRNKTFNDIDNLELLLRASFWGKRKTMLNNIRNNPYFKKDENKLKIAKFSENIINDSNMKNILSKRPDILEKEDFLNFLQFF